MRWLVRILGGLALAAALLFTVFVVGMRKKSAPVVDTVRRFNKSVTNRAVMRTAGALGAGAAVIVHTGRVSGRTYETPIGPFPTGDGYVIALPYGPRADWTKNVLAAGSATLRHQGETILVDRPEVVPTAEVLHQLPVSERRSLQLFGVGQCLVVHRSETEREAAPHPQ